MNPEYNQSTNNVVQKDYFELSLILVAIVEYAFEIILLSTNYNCVRCMMIMYRTCKDECWNLKISLLELRSSELHYTPYFITVPTLITSKAVHRTYDSFYVDTNTVL